jgi:hypothetical protein
MVSLTVLREQNEHTRFARQRQDDTRTAIPPTKAEALAAELRARIKGEVRFDAGSRALYATDGSNYRQAPIGVVIPQDKDDVIETVAAARRYGAPILSRGCGTSLGGQCCNVAVVMDFSKYMHGVLNIDPARRLGTVQPGCVLDDLRGAATKHGINFGPDPATHSHCTLGGMLGNDSCGSHSLLCRNAGRGLRVADNTHELEVLTYDGLRLRVGETPPDELERIIAAGGPRGDLYAKMKAFRDKYADEIRRRFPKLPRRVSGYNIEIVLCFMVVYVKIQMCIRALILDWRHHERQPEARGVQLHPLFPPRSGEGRQPPPADGGHHRLVPPQRCGPGREPVAAGRGGECLPWQAPAE